MLEAESIELRYRPGDARPALAGVTLAVDRGQWVAVMGPNGSGKSTLLRVLSGLLEPTEGRVRLGGGDIASLGSRAAIAARVGIVFQDPDTQIVSATVERDLAFGMEQLGIPGEEMRRRVEDLLDRFNLQAQRTRSPQSLSGGEKQRVALASVLAMQPDYILLDEPTALLDAKGRDAVLSALAELRSELSIGIVHVTACPDEALQADRLVALVDGKIAGDGRPRDVFSSADRCEEWGFARPAAAVLAEVLRTRGLAIDGKMMTVDEFIAEWESVVGIGDA